MAARRGRGCRKRRPCTLCEGQAFHVLSSCTWLWMASCRCAYDFVEPTKSYAHRQDAIHSHVHELRTWNACPSQRVQGRRLRQPLPLLAAMTHHRMRHACQMLAMTLCVILLPTSLVPSIVPCRGARQSYSPAKSPRTALQKGLCRQGCRYLGTNCQTCQRCAVGHLDPTEDDTPMRPSSHRRLM